MVADLQGAEEVVSTACDRHPGITEDMAGKGALNTHAMYKQTIECDPAPHPTRVKLRAAIANCQLHGEPLILKHQALEQVHMPIDNCRDTSELPAFQSLLQSPVYCEIFALMANNSKKRTMSQEEVRLTCEGQGLNFAELVSKILDPLLNNGKGLIVIAEVWRLRRPRVPAYQLVSRASSVRRPHINNLGIVHDNILLLFKRDHVSLGAIGTICSCPLLRQRARVEKKKEAVASSIASLVVPPNNNPRRGFQKLPGRLEEVVVPSMPIIAPFTWHSGVADIVDGGTAHVLGTGPLPVKKITHVHDEIRPAVGGMVDQLGKGPISELLIMPSDELRVEMNKGPGIALRNAIERGVAPFFAGADIAAFDSKASVPNEDDFAWGLGNLRQKLASKHIPSLWIFDRHFTDLHREGKGHVGGASTTKLRPDLWLQWR